MSSLVIFPIVTDKDMNPDALLQAAIGKMSEVIILGFDKDGDEWFSSSKADAGDIIYHLERAKHRLMTMIDQMKEGYQP